MKSLWQFYYLPSPTSSKQAKVLVYAENYEQAVESVKKVLKLDYGKDGKSKLIKQGRYYRHDRFDDITQADNQLGPGRSILTCLPPDQHLEFLQDYTQAMNEKLEREGRLRRGESALLKDIKMQLREKRAQQEAELRLEEHRRKIGYYDSTMKKQHLGKATGEAERVCDVARDF